MQRCLTLLFIKKMLSKTHSEKSPHTYYDNYYQKNQRCQMLVRMWRKGALAHCWWEQKLV